MEQEDEKQFLVLIPPAEKVIGKGWFHQVIPKKQLQIVYLISTEFDLYLFRKSIKEENEKYEMTTLPYKNLSSIDFIDEMTFRLCFDTIGRFVFIKDEPEKFIKNIYFSVCNVLTPKNYPKINKKVIFIPSGDFNDMIERRYRAFLVWKQSQASHFSLQRLRHYLKTKPKFIDLGIIEDLGLDIITFLEAINEFPQFHTIVVPSRQNSNYYKIIEKIIPLYSNVTHHIICECINQSLYDFLIFLSNFPITSIQTIQFKHCLINSKLIEHLKELLGKHQIALEFVACDILAEQEFNDLMQKSDNLTGISMSSVWFGRNFSLNHSKNLRKLVLRGCYLEMQHLLLNLYESTPFLEYLDLSKNFCVKEYFAPITFPPTITHLFFSQVQWSSIAFYIFFKSTCRIEKPFTLSLASAYFQQRKYSYEQFYTYFDLETSNIYALYWNNNAIRSMLLYFLLRCPNFKFFSIAGCKIKRHVSRTLNKFIENEKSLLVLDLHGTYKIQYTEFIPNFLNCVKKSQSIRRLDISNNKLDRYSIQKLAELITENPKIKQLLISDLDIDCFLDIQPLIDALKERKTTIYIDYPEKNFKFLQEKEDLTEEQILEIKSLFKQPISPVDQDCYEHWQRQINKEYQEWPKIDIAKKPIIVDDERHSDSNFFISEYSFTKSDIKMDLFNIPSLEEEDNEIIAEFEKNTSIDIMWKNLRSLLDI